VRVWDLETGAVKLLELEPPWGGGKQPVDDTAGLNHNVYTLGFTDESTLITAGGDGVKRWELETGSVEIIVETTADKAAAMYLSADRGTMLTLAGPPSHPWESSAVVHDLGSGASRELDLDPDCYATSFALDSSGEVVAESCEDGSVRVGKIADGVFHLLLGHEGPSRLVHISPDGAWVASTGDDTTLRLWPMPDLSKPPLHTLPHEELIAKLHSLTNLRAVRDEESSTGWKIEVGPFPGWETVPTW
jgi:WD40 repeat protein